MDIVTSLILTCIEYFLFFLEFNNEVMEIKSFLQFTKEKPLKIIAHYCHKLDWILIQTDRVKIIFSL